MLILAILAIFGVIVIARSFLMPVFLAFLLSITVSPIRRALAKRGIPSVVTAAVVVAGLLFGVVALAYALSGPVQEYARHSETIAREVESKLRGVNEAIEAVAEATEDVQSMAGADEDDVKGEQTQTVVVTQGPGILSRLATTAPAVVGQVVFTLALLFFLTASGDMFYRKIVEASPRFSDKRRALGIAFDIEKKLSRYFLTITVINAGLGVCVGAALWWAGMPNPLLFGVGAFALNFIPYLGAIAGVALTFFLGIVSMETIGQAVLAAGLYLGLTSLEGQFVTPYAVGRSLKLNPVVVFVSVAFWGWAWSFIGMFIAVPTLIAIRVFADHVPKMNALGIFLSGIDDDDEEDDGHRSATKHEAA
ncbi:AI-2E family transporter [Wenxinia marina]|uniref:Putative permease n=1 Tax=Wenxinia marina DSM 24838 TaxID=1123501 RepID=A0A0D0Q883_9RHOB|nr:AI-2E family transporter [Wenxinia marina]KIQ68617.1 putative permease [Wenxinia marina DSM 24838]GGL67312.1 AI-2E family transporter [Wenxinia marina]